MKKQISLLLILFIATGYSFGQLEGLPSNPEPGKCYIRCVTPDVYETVEKRLVSRPAYKKLEVVPAVYKTVEERVMIKPASKKFVYVPAEFKTVTEEIKVEDSFNEISINPARLAASSQEIEVHPKLARWEYQSSIENCKSDDPRDCMVLCYVEYPAEHRTVNTQVLEKDASIIKHPKGGKTITIEKQELVSAARVDEIEIPAEYKSITKRVLVKDEEVREIKVPEEYKVETIDVLQDKGGVNVWEEIECSLTDYNVLPIFYELGSARLTGESRNVINDKLLKLMREKPLIHVEISSHTDSRGTNESNMALSQRRAESVVNYLVANGIRKNRLIAKGYGETRLKNRCKDGVTCSEEEHQQNRRTEFRVLSN